jgi:hypothetical protein
MNEHVQVKEFTEFYSNQEEEVNKFLEKLGTSVISVTPLYNTISGGIKYVVIYWC